MNPTTQAISVPPPALNTNGPRKPRGGPGMADWKPPEWIESKPDLDPEIVYSRGLRAFMRLHRKSPARAVRLLRPDYRPADPTDPAAVLDAYRAWMELEVFPRWRWDFPARNGETLRRWERRSGRIVGADHTRLSGCGRRGAVQSAAVRRRRRRPRNADIWRWHRKGRGTLAIMADVAADWPELQIGARQIQRIVAEREADARCKRDTKAARAAEARRRDRARRDAVIAQRVRAGGDVRRVARSEGVSPATARRACVAAGVPVSAAVRAEADYQACIDAINARLRAEAFRPPPAPVPLWKWCGYDISPHGAI